MAITRIKNNQITDATITNVKILSQTLTGDLMNPNLTFNSNLTLNGNLVVTGNVTAVQSTTTQITDPLLTLGLGNAGTSYDLGLVLIRGSGGNRFIGWKENQGAFVFIDTTEDGLTTGNIATTAYANVIFGNAITLGSSTFGGITLSGNTISAAGALTVRSDAGTVTIPNAAVVTGATILSSTLSVVGAATVASLTSNAGIIGTTGSFSSNLTGAALTVNGSATIGTTLGVTGNINGSGISLTGSLTATGTGDFDGGLQNTPIGNAAPSTALFTTVGASGNATIAALTVNGTATIGSTLGVVGNINGTSATLTGTATIGSTLGVVGNINGSGITLTGSLQATGTGDFDGGLQSTPIGNVAPSTALFTTVGASGNATVAALTVNGTATIGSTLGVTGTLTGAAAQFTTINGSGAATVASLGVNGAVLIGTTLGVNGATTVSSLTVNNAITAATGTILGNLLVEGNLRVLGNLSYINVDEFVVEDPIIQLNTGPNGSPLSADNGFDVGVRAHYYDTADRSSFFGYKDSTGFFEYYSNVTSESGNVITGTLGTIRTGNLQLTGLASVGTTLAVAGNATVNALTVNNSATVAGTLGVVGNINGTSATLTGAATIGSTLGVVGNINGTSATLSGSIVTTGPGQHLGGLQATPIGNAAASTGQFTTLSATGNVTGSALTVNGSATIGSTLGVTGNVVAGNLSTTNINATNGIFTNNVTVEGTLTATSNIVANTSGIFFGNNVTGLNALYAGLPIYTVLPTTVAQFTTNVNSYAQVNTQNLNSGEIASADFVATADNGDDESYFINMGIASSGHEGYHDDFFADVSTANDGYLYVVGYDAAGPSIGNVGNLLLGSTNGLVKTFVGNTDQANVVTTHSYNQFAVNVATVSSGFTTGALVVAGGVGVAGALNVQTRGNIGNVTISNLTISSNITNQGLNINPNGTGVTTINSGLNNSRTVINGTAANTLVVSGTQVGVNTSSFISGATLQVNALDSMLLPVGAIGDRPGSPVPGMIRYSTSQGTIEWYNGAAWSIPTGDFTVVVANSQTGNGSATVFTLPVANASTAGTIVSINGVVQQPTSAYSITGANVTFTEAPASTDVIDFRVFTTTSQVTEVTDIAGTTGLFFDLPTAGSQKTTIKTAGTESFSIEANSTARFTGNVEPSANITYSLGSTTNRWKDLWLSGTTIYLGNIQIQNTTGNTVSFVTSSGTPAALTVDISDPSGIQNTPIGNASASTGNFTTIGATGNISGTSITLSGSLVATGPGDFDGGLQSTPIGNATPSSGAFTTLSATGALTVNSTNGVTAIVNGGTNGTGNIGASGAGFNTIFAKSTSAQYADLAENYAADAEYEPGTVVHFGGSHEVTLCDEDMCRRIAGVVSTNPAYLMNSHLQGFAAAVALQGRVPCKVRGAVSKGDMMVSAGGGYARAEANPVLGSVIGKALENFEGLEGVIEVVVGRV